MRRNKYKRTKEMKRKKIKFENNYLRDHILPIKSKLILTKKIIYLIARK
jgi:hypothetical protein